MASERQIKANRRNARRSTGPTTEEGRRASSLNALKHGFRSPRTVLPGENEAEFQALFDAFAEEAAPRDLRDLTAVRKIAACEWRLRRLAAIETEMFSSLIAKARSGVAPDFNTALQQVLAGPIAAAQTPNPASFSDLQIVARRFLEGDLKNFTALARYEASLDRQYQNAWRELDSRPDPVPEIDQTWEPGNAGLPAEPTAPDAWQSSLDLYAAAARVNPTEPATTPGVPGPALEDESARTITQDPVQPAENSPQPVPAGAMKQSKPIPHPDSTRIECSPLPACDAFESHQDPHPVHPDSPASPRP